MVDRGGPGESTVQFQWHNLAILGVIALGLVLPLLVVFVPAKPHNALHHPGVGKKLPNLALQPLTAGGQPISLAELSGKVVVIDFWGPWDKQCREQMPHIAALEKKYSDRPDFKLLAVSCGQGGKDNKAKLLAKTTDFLKKAGIELPIYCDPDEAARAIVDKVAGFDAFPTVLVVDRDGVIRAVWTGFPADRQMRISQRMDELVGQVLEERK
jgi:thiol-disulfide isomerase/thioredoxin